MTASDDLLSRYERSLLTVFGRPQTVLSHGEGARVWDVDGREYLDLLGGIAVNALGHAHPALIAAVTEQAGKLIHVSNFFTTEPQVALAEKILQAMDAPEGSSVFFTNSGAEAIEGAIKVARTTGRTGIVAMERAFHGRTTGSVALTHKEVYRKPFEPLLPGVTHVPFGDIEALQEAVTEQTSAVFLEPIQGEGGVQPATVEYLQAVRAHTRAVGALLVLDEIQTGMGRTGDWFAFQESGIVPDVVTLAKGLGGGVPIGAFVLLGADNTARLVAGQHGSTFGGNPLATAAGLAVFETIEKESLLDRARELGEHLVDVVVALGDARIVGVRGRGLLRGIVLRDEVAAPVTAAAREAGFLVNAVAPDVLRLAPPLVVTAEQLDSFVAALPGLLDRADAAASAPKEG